MTRKKRKLSFTEKLFRTYVQTKDLYNGPMLLGELTKLVRSPTTLNTYLKIGKKMGLIERVLITREGRTYAGYGLTSKGREVFAHGREMERIAYGEEVDDSTQ